MITVLQKLGLDISYESSAWQNIYNGYQDVFFVEKDKTIACRLLQTRLGDLRVKSISHTVLYQLRELNRLGRFDVDRLQSILSIQTP